MSEQHVDYQDRDGNQARIAYSRTGHGAPVVLIHGVGLQGTIWKPQIEALKASHDVIAVDMPGHGGSSLPPANATLSHYADAVLALLDALKVGRAHLVGHSMGALVAIEFALAHPDRVASLVAMNAVFCRTPEQRAAIEARVSALGENPSPDWSGTIGRWFGEPVPPSLKGAAAHTHALLSKSDPVGYERTYRLFARSDTAHRERLPQLAVPALFFTGEHDPNSTPSMSEAMAGIAPRGRAIVLSGERHMMALTDPDRTNQILTDFIDETERTERPMQSAQTIDPRAFRKALGSFLTGVTVVATLQEDGGPRGFTANSFTSVSLDPPLVLVCIAKTASSCPVFSSAAHFSVNVLAEHQASVSMLFASKAADKFAQAAWRRGPAGSPIIDGVAAWFDCSRHEVVDAGDHIILIGKVVGFEERPANPLGYCKGAHVTFGLQIDALAASGGRTLVGAILEHDGAIVLVEDGKGGLDLPKSPALGGVTEADGLIGYLRRLGLEAELGFLFSVFEDTERGAGAMSIVYRGTLREAPQTGAAVTLASIDSIPWERIRGGALNAMLHRYIEERQQDEFGIYVGDAERGTVQSLARSA
jgi:flavin reductase (DIM6/NTAB) family NADH-FMN oxidoreductase RutF/pimeloyl-ACP methyl ester carboxylesterase